MISSLPPAIYIKSVEQTYRAYVNYVMRMTGIISVMCTL